MKPSPHDRHIFWRACSSSPRIHDYILSWFPVYCFQLSEEKEEGVGGFGVADGVLLILQLIPSMFEGTRPRPAHASS